MLATSCLIKMSLGHGFAMSRMVVLFYRFSRFDSSFYVKGESPLYKCFLRILVIRRVLSLSFTFLCWRPYRYGDNLADFSKLAILCTIIRIGG